MDSSSRRAAALHKESMDLASEAMAIKKAMPNGAEKPPRLREICVRLKAIESEYSRLLTASPMSAVTLGSESDVLQSENKELQRRNAELERKVASLQQGHQEAKQNQSVLQQRQMQAERDLIAARKEIKAGRQGSNGNGNGNDRNDFVLEEATEQLQNAADKVDAIRVETEQKAALIEEKLEATMKDLATSRRNAGDLRADLDRLETAFAKQVTRAEAAESLVSDLRKDLASISSELMEAKSLLQDAQAEEEAGQRSGAEGQQAMLRKWAEDELQRLQQQLAATTA